MPFANYRRAVSEPEELNLIPVMNLFMTLIPFLLMGAAFVHMATIPTSLPQHTPEASDVPKTPATVTATLRIEPDKLAVTAASTSLDEAQLAALAGEFAAPAGAYDLPALQGHLAGIKARYPKSNTLIVVGHDALATADLVRILDAAREIPEGEVGGEPVFAELFPVSVFTRLIPSEDDAAPTEADEAAP